MYLAHATKIISGKCIFKRKLKLHEFIEKCKACLVIKGFKQSKGIDRFDTFALKTKISSIRVLISLAPIHNLVIHEMDVNNAFLNRELEEEFYMDQHESVDPPFCPIGTYLD